MSEYSLTLRTSIKQGNTFVRDLTSDAQMWQRSTRLQGGYWQGSFRIIAPMAELIDYFHSWLGYDFEETVGGVQTWRGMVYEMTLVTPNASRVRSYDTLYNYITIAYTGGVQGPLTATVNTERYGRREYYEDVGDISATAALAYIWTYFMGHGWPYVRPVSGGINTTQDQEAYLDVTVVGYVFTMNFRHTTTADESTFGIGYWINTIFSTDCTEFLTLGYQITNSTLIKRHVDSPTRCWELIDKLVRMGDTTGRMYRAWVYDRKFSYDLLDITPQYYIVRGKLSQNLSSPELINPWTVKPGIFRDMDYPIKTQEIRSGLADSRDIIVEEISCGADSGLSWQALDFDEAAQQALLNELEGYTDAGGDVESGSKKTTNWKRKAGLKPGTKAWEEASKMGKTAWLAAHPKKRG